MVRAPPRVLPRSPAPCGLLGGGPSGPGSPLPGLGLLLRGASEVRRSPSPDCPPTGWAVGVRYPRAVGAAVWVWVPNTVPLACTPCGGCVPRGWCVGGPSPGGVACHCCEGRLVSGPVPPPTARPLRQAAGVPRPVCSGCGRCGCGDPAPAPRLAPLRAGVARCGGGGRASPGGVPSAVVRGVWGQALPLPRLPAPWAGCRGPLPTGCGCGGLRAWGPVTNPTARAFASWLCALWGRHEGARGGRLLPGCGASGVGRSPNPECPPSGRAVGAHYPLAVGARGCGLGDPSPTPQRALMRAVGAA